MDENKRKKIVYLIFVAAVIYGVINFAGRASRKTDMSSAEPIPAVEAAAVAIAPVDTATALEYEWARDPFSYGTGRVSIDDKPASKDHGLRLSAVSEAQGKYMAIIDGTPVMEGESVDGWTVMSLTKTKAVLSRDGKEITLEIGR